MPHLVSSHLPILHVGTGQDTHAPHILRHTRTPHPQAGPGGGRGPGQAPNPGPPLNTCGQITQPALSLALLGARWGKHGPHGPSPRPALEGCSTSRGEARDAHGKNTGKTDGDRLLGSAVTEQGKQGHACSHPPVSHFPIPHSVPTPPNFKPRGRLGARRRLLPDACRNLAQVWRGSAGHVVLSGRPWACREEHRASNSRGDPPGPGRPGRNGGQAVPAHQTRPAGC